MVFVRNVRIALAVLDDYCREYGMVVNESKTKFMAFNGDDGDRLPFQLGNLSICHCDSYTYLGVTVTADGLAESSLKAHASDKLTQLNKLNPYGCEPRRSIPHQKESI